MTGIVTEYDSTAVGRSLYDPDTLTLDLWFVGGDRYSYFKVPPDVHDALLATDAAGGSVGAFVNERIKPFFDYAPHARPARRV